MLQAIGNLCWYSLFILLYLPMVLASCKLDSSRWSEEKTAYLADYERTEDPWGYIDTTGTIVIEPIYDDVNMFSESKAAVNQNGLWGYIDDLGKVIITPQFQSAFIFHENRARVKPFDLSACYVTPSGAIISSPDWNAVGDFSNGRAVVKAGHHFGFIDTSGKLVIHPVFSSAGIFDHHRAVVGFGDKQGVIDENEIFILKTEYDHLTLFGDCNMILGSKDNDALLFDFDGHQNDHISGATPKETDGKLVSIQKENKMWLYEIASKKYLPDNGFHQLIYLGENRWAAKQDSLFYLLDDHGKILTKYGYDQLNKFVSGIAVYSRHDYWGYLDTSGHQLTAPIFGLAWDYCNGYARAAFKDGITYIDMKQEVAFYPLDVAFELRDFNEGFSPIQIKKSD